MNQKTALAVWVVVAFVMACLADKAVNGGGGVFFFTFACLVGLAGAVAGPSLGPTPRRQHTDD